MVTKYQKRISGPLLDRIDIHIQVPRVEYEKLSDQRVGEPSKVVRARVEAARERQRARFSGSDVACNADMRPAEVRKYCTLDDTGTNPDENRHEPVAALGTRLSPVIKIGENHCGPGRERANSAIAPGRSITISSEGNNWIILWINLIQAFEIDFEKIQLLDYLEFYSFDMLMNLCA